jgi:hypothetical protein
MKQIHGAGAGEEGVSKPRESLWVLEDEHHQTIKPTKLSSNEDSMLLIASPGGEDMDES